jgi:hypothetical protein
LSQVLKLSALIAAATVVIVGFSSARDPVNLVTAATSSLVYYLAPRPTTNQGASPIERSAEKPALTHVVPTVNETLSSAAEDMAANEQRSEALQQFQVWAAEQDARANVGSVPSVQGKPPQVAQNDRAQVAEDTRTLHRSTEKRGHVRPVRNARAEMRMRRLRGRLLSEQSAPVQTSAETAARKR